MTVQNGATTGFSGSINLPDEAATVNLGQSLAVIATDGDVILLRGDLGAGKTALARGLIRHLCGLETEVPSPTFTLLQQYDAPLWTIHHFDLYRIAHPDEAIEIGFEDILGDGLCLIEWPERLAGWLPSSTLSVDLMIDGTGRAAKVRSKSGAWRERLESSDLWDKLTTDDDA